MSIQQSELPTMERPRIDVLDESIGNWLDAKRAAKTTKDAAADALAIATDKMHEAADELEKNDHDNPCYVYRDGTKEIAVSIASSSKLVSEVIIDGGGGGSGDAEGDGDGIG